MTNEERNEQSGLSRRRVLAAAGGGAMAAAVAAAAPAARAMQEVQPADAQPADSQPVKRKGRIKQAVCGGVFRKMGRMSLEDKCKLVASLGCVGMDFIGPNDWPTLKQHGLICTLTRSHGLGKGLNDKSNHEGCLAAIRKGIEATSAAGFPNVITFSGNRVKGMSDEEGADNMVEALKQVAGEAEKGKVNLVIELLNSKVNHKGYQADRTPWTVDICKRVGSPNVKVLYDIYHMQIMEGDVIRTIRDNIDYIGHVHTAGNPGRNELDENQELYYPAIMRALADAGYKYYVSHEYGPKGDPMKALKQALDVCDV